MKSILIQLSLIISGTFMATSLAFSGQTLNRDYTSSELESELFDEPRCQLQAVSDAALESPMQVSFIRVLQQSGEELYFVELLSDGTTALRFLPMDQPIAGGFASVQNRKSLLSTEVIAKVNYSARLKGRTGTEVSLSISDSVFKQARTYYQYCDFDYL